MSSGPGQTCFRRTDQKSTAEIATTYANQNLMSTAPGIRPRQPDDHFDYRRLARAVWAQEAESLPLLQLERDPFHSPRVPSPVALAQIENLEHGGHGSGI